ncbi:hypothetical protein N9544_07380 [Flavobacteriales bacterium]|nr:hypothetical protein [Flavobacteriales bacterium]
MFKTKLSNIPLVSDRNIYLVLFLFAFVFIVIRALSIPLFVDEIATYTLYVKNGYFSPFNEFEKANNHLVNTFLTYISYSIFGNSPISLRLFNVLAFIPFGVFIFKIGLFFKHRIVKWAFYLGFLFSINLLAYFSLSRGYGLSFTFVIISIYYTFQTINRNRIWDVPLSVITMMLALYSNFSLLLFVCISGLILLITIWIKKKFFLHKNNLLKVALSIIVYLTSIIFALKILFHFKEKGILWWGHLNGFWEDTVYTLIQNIFLTYDNCFVVQGLIIICSVFILIMALRKSIFSANNLFFYFLFWNVIGIILMAQLFDVNYPFQRTGAHLYLFFIGALCFAIDRVNAKKLLPFVLILMFLIPVHFIVDFNTDYVVHWDEDNLPDEFFEKVKEIESSKKQDYIPSIYIEGTTIACWDYKYYNDYQEYMPLSFFKRDTVKWLYDYVIDREENVEKFGHLYEKIENQETSKMALYKRKSTLERELITENEITLFQGIDKEFYELVNYKLDSVESSSFNVEVTAGIEYHKRPFNSKLVVTIENSITQEKYDYKLINLFTKDDWVEYEPLKSSVFMNSIPIGEKVNIKVFIWNLNEVTYNIHSSSVKINKVKNNSY